MARSFLAAVLTALFSTPVSAFNIDWVPVGNPGNPSDTPIPTKCYVPECGSVAYEFRISKYETTNAQYAEFLNAVDPDGGNSLALYNPSMDGDTTFGGISFAAGNDPGTKYVVKPGFETKPVNYVSFYDALRFANWFNNGKGSGDTESGAYTLLGGDDIPSNGLTVMRNAGADVVLTSENEWYKAAYYSPAGFYFGYPTGTDILPVCVAPASDTGNSANCNGAGAVLTDVGAYLQSESPYGTYDQGGNVAEWNESIVVNTRRGFRGGSYGSGASDLFVTNPYDAVPTTEYGFLGFRVAIVPEPGSGLLGMTAVLGLGLLAIHRTPSADPARTPLSGTPAHPIRSVRNS